MFKIRKFDISLNKSQQKYDSYLFEVSGGFTTGKLGHMPRGPAKVTHLTHDS